jgi:hypothetical protein
VVEEESAEEERGPNSTGVEEEQGTSVEEEWSIGVVEEEQGAVMEEERSTGAMEEERGAGIVEEEQGTDMEVHTEDVEESAWWRADAEEEPHHWVWGNDRVRVWGLGCT